MDISSNAIIALGIPLEEENPLPWNQDEDSEYFYDSEGWWRHINGFTYSTKNDCKVRSAEAAEWDKTHPMPFELVRHCSDEYTMYFLAVPGTVTTVSHGYPQTLDLNKLSKVDLTKIHLFIEFIKKYKISEYHVVQWHLMSYIG